MIRGITFAALLMAAPSIAQQAPETDLSEPPEPSSEHLIYNLTVEPAKMFVRSDCEGAEGNAGEWVYKISLTAPGREVSTGTPRYPSREGIVSWSDETAYPLQIRPAELNGIGTDDLGSVEIHLRATEWDPDFADPTMDDLVVSQSVDFSPESLEATIDLDGGRCAITLSYSATWQESRKPGIYDMAGNQLFRPEKNGELLFDDAGHEYYYDEQWTRISRDGGIIVSYHFNQRKWDVVEDLPITTSPIFEDRVDKDLIERSYKSDGGVFTATTQGNHPLLTLKNGTYVDELGKTVYIQHGKIRGWHRIVLMHRHYQEVYQTNAFDEIREQREIAAAQFAESNSLTVDILDWSKKYKSRNKKKEVMYFAEAGGEIFVLTDEQMQQVRNAWLVLNPKPRMASWPHYIPEASFKLSKGKAKKRGVNGVESRHFVLELKVLAEYAEAFRKAVTL